MLFENKHSQRYRAERLNAWIEQVAGLFTSMAASRFVAATVMPLVDGNWPSSPGLWVVSGVVLFLMALLFLNHIAIEGEP